MQVGRTQRCSSKIRWCAAIYTWYRSDLINQSRSPPFAGQLVAKFYDQLRVGEVAFCAKPTCFARGGRRHRLHFAATETRSGCIDLGGYGSSVTRSGVISVGTPPRVSVGLNSLKFVQPRALWQFTNCTRSISPPRARGRRTRRRYALRIASGREAGNAQPIQLDGPSFWTNSILYIRRTPLGSR